MAKKDTFNALIRKGINEGDAERLLTKYNTIKSISEASVSDIMELSITEDDAAFIISALGKKSTSSVIKKTKSEKKESVEDIVFEKMEIKDKSHKLKHGEEELIEICERNDVLVIPYHLKSGSVSVESRLIPLKVISEIARRIYSDYEGKCETVKEGVTQEKKEQLVLTAARMCDAHKVCMNEPVGVVSSQSLGEPATQMNLRTFHYAGVANINVTKGLPRLIEIVEARMPRTPSMVIPLKKGNSELAPPDERMARKVSYLIEETTLNNVAEIITDDTHMVLTIRPDNSKMQEREITIEDIFNKLNSHKDISGCIEIDEEGNINIACKDCNYQKLLNICDRIKTEVIKGIPNITRAVLHEEKNGEWVIYTEGSNLSSVMGIPHVDVNNIETNNIPEVASVLGIEAARKLIIKEAYGTLSEAGLDVDIRHIMLVADLMTNTGFLRGLGASTDMWSLGGIVSEKSSPLLRASFERIKSFIEETAIMGQSDSLKGVVENIIVGQPIKLGTGAVDLIYKPKNKGNIDTEDNIKSIEDVDFKDVE